MLCASAGSLARSSAPVLGAQENREARFRLFFVGLGEERNNAADHDRTLLALARPAAVIEQKAIQPVLMVRLGQQRADALEQDGVRCWQERLCLSSAFAARALARASSCSAA